jgi:hypothetical protein
MRIILSIFRKLPFMVTAFFSAVSLLFLPWLAFPSAEIREASTFFGGWA